MEARVFYRSKYNLSRLVLVVEARKNNSDAICALLQGDGCDTTVASDLKQAKCSIEQFRPDLIIVSAVVAGESAIPFVKDVKSDSSSPNVLVLASEDDLAQGVAFMKAGATDVLSPSFDGDALIGASRDTFHRDLVLVSEAGDKSSVQVSGFRQLTAREREVLAYLASGMSNKQTAWQLGISARTVEVHRARIMHKLGARNTADLMRIVLTS